MRNDISRFVTGNLGTTIKTTDGGATWTSLPDSSDYCMKAVYFKDPNTGIAVGNDVVHGGGVALKTTNGGITWDTLQTGTYNIFNSLCFPDPNTGYIVGMGGTILQTSTGGGVYAEDHTLTPSTLKIYPNPSGSVIFIELSKIPLHGSLSIMNLWDEVVLTYRITGCKTQLDISTLSAGVYFVQLSDEKIVYVGKFIKN